MGRRLHRTGTSSNPIKRESSASRSKWRSTGTQWNGGLEEANARLELEIEERKNAEEALRASEENYRDLVEHINDVIYRVRKDGTILFVSGAVEQLFGYSPTQMEGHNFSEMIYEADLEKLAGEFGDVLSGNLYPSEYRVKTASGKIRWVRSSSRPYFDNAEPAGIQGVMSDISLRKWARRRAPELA